MATGTELVEGTALHWSDILVIIVYFAFVLFIGLWVSKTVIAIFEVGLPKSVSKYCGVWERLVGIKLL